MSSGTSQNKREKLIIYEARFCPQQCIMFQNKTNFETVSVCYVGVLGSEYVFIRV